MDTKDSKPAAIHLEEVPYVKPGFNNVVGTVKLIDCDEIVLVPTPTTDPAGSDLCVYVTDLLC